MKERIAASSGQRLLPRCAPILKLGTFGSNRYPRHGDRLQPVFRASREGT